jgi:hypothetical protein
MQPVSIRIYDRRRGYSGIRTVRQALVAWGKTVETLPISDGSTQGCGMLGFEYAGRTGLLVDRTYNVIYEEVRFVAKMFVSNEIA